jgi:hypothetical protein
MKAALALDQFADTSALTEKQRTQIAFRRNRLGTMEMIFPAGTIFEGDDAVRMCRIGQAVPADAECADAVGMSKDKLASVQVKYRMNVLGINNKEDRELYEAGVILGYDDKLEYLHGPNWDAYQLAKSESNKAEDNL